MQQGVDASLEDEEDEDEGGQEGARRGEPKRRTASAAASTRGAPPRRQAMLSRIVVQKVEGAEKYTLALSASQTVAEIDKVIAARKHAMIV